ncbi:hypothetical protein DM860_009063 [Cuscuta australis]|uniref:Nudix hydrolase domain-containing protein n=1 Tax=Cuscuta australis TaxID=267555 RepID=A0A328DC64_9ASTE|nr:hypothetical protein DM860_009063 [Cuscuta australis]
MYHYMSLHALYICFIEIMIIISMKVLYAKDLFTSGVKILEKKDDKYGGVVIEMKEMMNPSSFAASLKASLFNWRLQGKKGVWLKLPIELSDLVDVAKKEGFWYHHAEKIYIMMVYWIPKTPSTLPSNASHKVGIGAFVINEHEEMLVVQEKNGYFAGTGFWKMPTGLVEEGEDVCDAAVREVKEETGIDAEFVEFLAFRQYHKALFSKSDLFFVCKLKPLSTTVTKQDSEIETAKWMKMEEYCEQSYVKEHEGFLSVAEICKMASSKKNAYSGFSANLKSQRTPGKKSYVYSSASNI